MRHTAVVALGVDVVTHATCSGQKVSCARRIVSQTRFIRAAGTAAVGAAARRGQQLTNARHA
jgi:hypothetical protein